MSDTPFKVWSKEIQTDVLTNSPNRREISEEEANDGLLRGMFLSAQVFNELMYKASAASTPVMGTPFMWNSAVAVPDDCIEFNGQSVSATDAPNVFAHWGTPLKDLRNTPVAGVTWVARKL